MRGGWGIPGYGFFFIAYINKYKFRSLKESMEGNITGNVLCLAMHMLLV